MTHALRILVAALFAGGAALPAAAQAPSGPTPDLSQQISEEIEVGTSVICDTQAQMERFVAVFEGDYEKAMKTVNTEQGNETACIGATMAFMRGNELSKASNLQGTFHIIRVMVIGINTDEGFLAIQPAPFFSLVKDEVEEVEV